MHATEQITRELQDIDLEQVAGGGSKAPVNTTVVQPTRVVERVRIVREPVFVPVPVLVREPRVKKPKVEKLPAPAKKDG